MNTATALIEAKIDALKAQASVTRGLMETAASREDLGAAKFALGMLAGSLILSDDENTRYEHTRSAILAGESLELDLVLSIFVSMERRAYELIEEFEEELLADRRRNSY